MPKKLAPKKNPAAAALGRKGGRAWSKTLATMTAEERAAEMKRRVAVRWAKPRPTSRE